MAGYLEFLQTFLEEKFEEGFWKGEDRFADKVFENMMIRYIKIGKECHKNNKFKDALVNCFHKLHLIKQEYINMVGGKMKGDLILKFIEYEALIMYPIRPVLSDHIWRLLQKKSKIENEKWPNLKDPDLNIIRKYHYFNDMIQQLRTSLNKKIKSMPKNQTNFETIRAKITYVEEYEKWQIDILEHLKSKISKDNEEFPEIETKEFFSKIFLKNKELNNIMKFISFMKIEYQNYGLIVLDGVTMNLTELFLENVSYIKSTLQIENIEFEKVDLNHESKAKIFNPKVQFL